MSFTTDIQTIAKTRLLEEKVGKALNLAEIANQNVKAPLLGERNTANQDMTVVVPGNPPPVVGVGTGGTLPAAPQPVPASVIPPISQGTAVAAVANPGPQTNNNQAVTGRTGGGGSASSTTPTDVATKANDDPMTSGTAANTMLNAILQDPIALGIYNKMTAAGFSTAAKEQAIADYMNGKTDADGNNVVAPGTVTTKQIADNLSPMPSASIIGNSFGDLVTNGGASSGVSQVTTAVGYDPSGEVSAKTGLVKTVAVYLNGQSIIPPLSESQADGQYQEWTSSIPPIYIGWQLNKIWSINISGGYASSAEGAMAKEAARILAVGLYDPSYSNLRVTACSAGSPPDCTGGVINQYQCDFVYYDAPGKDPAHKFDAPNTVISKFNSSVSPSDASATQPSYTAYPRSGTYYKQLVGSLFKSNLLDSESPFIHAHTDSSQVMLGVGDGVNNIDGRFVQIKLGISGGLLFITYPSLPTFTNGVPSVAPTSGIFLDSTLVVTIPNIPGSELQFYTP